MQPGRVALGVSRDPRSSAELNPLVEPVETRRSTPWRPAPQPLVEPVETPLPTRWSSPSRPAPRPLVELVETQLPRRWSSLSRPAPRPLVEPVETRTPTAGRACRDPDYTAPSGVTTARTVRHRIRMSAVSDQFST